MKKLYPCSVLWVLLAMPPLHAAATAPQPSKQAADPITGAEPAEGFGVNQGGLGGEEVIVATFAELANAMNRDNVYIRVKGDLVATGTTLGKGSNITIDGEGPRRSWAGATPASGCSSSSERTS